MRKFRRGSEIVEAVQITNSTFDASHPNEEHLIGVQYDPVGRTAEIVGKRRKAGVSDWIVKDALGDLYICSAKAFTTDYEPQ